MGGFPQLWEIHNFKGTVLDLERQRQFKMQRGSQPPAFYGAEAGKEEKLLSCKHAPCLLEKEGQLREQSQDPERTAKGQGEEAIVDPPRMDRVCVSLQSS